MTDLLGLIELTMNLRYLAMELFLYKRHNENLDNSSFFGESDGISMIRRTGLCR